MKLSPGKMIAFVFNLLIFTVPLALYPFTSELFEFNKMIIVYLTTIIVGFLWVADMITKQKIVLKRTILDIPLIIFIATQSISTIVSIDPRTSLFGYYSRFNGGLLSIICYAILYWAFVTHMDKSRTMEFIKTLFLGTAIAALYAALEHFGSSPSCLLITGQFNVECWVQEVQTRVFGTFGQPNWLATWLVAVIPLSWATLFRKTNNFWLSLLFSVLLFVTLLFTKSRSAFLGFVISLFVFWPSIFYVHKKKLKKVILVFIFTASYLLLATILVDTPWRTSLFNKIGISSTSIEETVDQSGETVLSRGGTESGEIRKIVWQGAIDLWKAYPMFGSGVETFAYAYYQFRPTEHNLVSEWNYLYNKAHNEYLNYLATTGAAGLGAYLSFVITSLLIILNFQFSIFKSQSIKNFKINKLVNSLKVDSKLRLSLRDWSLIIPALAAGYLAILVSNFFGFSVVPTNLLLFLFPAVAIALKAEDRKLKTKNLELTKTNNTQKTAMVLMLLATCYLLLTTIKYWRADILYAQSTKFEKQGELIKSVEVNQKAVDMFPNEPLFRDQLGKTYASLAVLASENQLENETQQFTAKALSELNAVKQLSPRNVKLLKSISNGYADLAQVDSEFLQDEIEIVELLTRLAPTDAGIFYRYGLVHAKLGQTEKAFEILDKTIEMKPDYKTALRLRAFLYIQEDRIEEAKQDLHYILEKISPDDEIIREELQKLEEK